MRIETTRYVLRAFAAEDIDALNYVDDPQFRRHLGPGFPDAAALLANNLAEGTDAFNFVIEHEGVLIGSVHLGLGAPANVGEFACLIRPGSLGPGSGGRSPHGRSRRSLRGDTAGEGLRYLRGHEPPFDARSGEARVHERRRLAATLLEP